MTRQYRQLILHPEGLNETLTTDALAGTLAELEVIGMTISPQWPHRYFIGEKFLQYLSFMGCAPALEFKPPDLNKPDWSSFTYVGLTTPTTTARCLIDTMMAKPACPHCGKRHAVVNSHITDAVICPKCQQSANIEAWDWREFGGCARQFISVVNVYPKESIPTDTLLQHLHEKTQLSWRYFYINDALLDEHDS